MKIAVVTGSSKGIGAGIAKYLLKKDFQVYVTYFKEKEKAEKEFGGNPNAIIKQLDVTNEENVINFFNQISENTPALDFWFISTIKAPAIILRKTIPIRRKCVLKATALEKGNIFKGIV